jgi:hypothetical protein
MAGVTTKHFRNIIQEGLSSNYITRNLLSGLEKLDKGFKDGQFKPNATSREEAIDRTAVILEGIPKAREIAQEYLTEGGTDSLGGEGSEAYFRVRLLSQINGSMRRGGIMLPDESLEKDVTGAIIRVVKELNPELTRPLLSEISMSEKKV